MTGTARLLDSLGRVWIGLLLLFLYLPLGIMAAMSFNASPFYQLPFDGTGKWYVALAGNEALLRAAWNSVRIALLTAAIATPLGIGAALALFRHDFRGKRVLQAALFPPIAIPWLISGTAMLIFFFGTGIGRGKTTLLRLIAGFDRPDSGRILIGGDPVERVPVERRDIGMVFQNYALFPNMSAAENVAFGLRVRGARGRAVAGRVGEALDLVRLGPYGRRMPHQLSGGQRQRVALGRAIVTDPRVLLLDEPLSALDKALRTEMQIELKRIQRETGITTVFVTHDQEEALSMADRIGILRDGSLVQEGPPEIIYNQPVTEFAATFLGAANILRGVPDAGGLRLPGGTLIRAGTGADTAAGEAVCAVRPERIEIAPAAGEGTAAGDENTLRGRISRCLFSGSTSTYFVDCGAFAMTVVVQNRSTGKLDEGTEVVLRWPPDSTVMLEG